ncbi:uncharacterized protein C8R40DRAFT_1092048 [Lentinula edodes]|uniref:uncharacterized protein n=1 Tax=Lentinula edodes TaxID=5353 RepID=UPI001E8D44C9|nr:uncharacterized protein C8R40DRAFT_1092048 [Lentinula edodes]KAH7878291.1 hypothetical protein C8R40DRAFT_1092048 [Lentinula edodes]
MDSSAVNFNVTADDFDSVLSYPDQSIWATPDPSSSDYHPKISDTVNASNKFNFTEVLLDSSSVTAYSLSNGSTPHLPCGARNLTYGEHEITLHNLGAISGNGPGGGNPCYVIFCVLQLNLHLVGTWGSNTSGNFSGGGSSYTNDDDASASFPLNGSTIYVFSDQKNDHGLYSVVHDNGTEQIFDGVSRCEGVFGQTCKQQRRTLEGEHSLSTTNLAGVNQSYFSASDSSGSSPGNSAPGSGSGSSPNSTNAALLTRPISPVSTHWFILYILGICIWLLNRR